MNTETKPVAHVTPTKSVDPASNLGHADDQQHMDVGVEAKESGTGKKVKEGEDKLKKD